MKATELRIGNYLNTKDGKLAIVEKITKDDFIAYSGMITKLPLSPIPLTEEWLLKFGFKERRLSYLLKINNITSLRMDGIEIFQPCLIQVKDKVYLSKIKYVHQLQNLCFALTGEELKTK